MATTPAADKPTTDKAAKAKKTIPALRVVARTPGFRRAGRAFGAEPTEIPLADLKKEQITALRNERELVVTDVEIEVQAEEDPKS